MAISLRDLRKYLGAGKLHLEEVPDGPHLGYLVRSQGRKLGLPTVLRVSHGAGEAAHCNLKGVAQALGLRERELEISANCGIGRGCVLVMLGWRLLEYAALRRQQIHSESAATNGIKAMIESVGLLLEEPEVGQAKPWEPQEMKALTRVRDAAARAPVDPLLGPAAERMLLTIARRWHG